MTARIVRDPSPVRSGFVHGAMGLLTLVGTFGLGGAAIQLVGNADAASPALRVSLFDEGGQVRPDLNPRLDDGNDLRPAVGVSYAATYDTTDEPDLGVDYAGDVDSSNDQPAAIPVGAIRINGQAVLPGQSLSQVSGTTVQASAKTAAAAPAEVNTAEIKPEPKFDAFARPFVNMDQRPTVSVVVGGLGINRGRTNAAIDELPPEVTLSFAPSTINLQSWINRARAAGHEVLIEVPMEPYDYGRERPHPQILQIAAGNETNTRRLNTLLSRVRGYTGVMNYQGGKFATSQEAAAPVFDVFEQRGLSFFEDGTLSRSVFEATARQEGVKFGKAGAWIDARPEADEISNQLLMLEAEALERGRSLGVGMSYPVTIELLKEWIVQLDGKGIELAPASYYAQRSNPAGQVEVAALDPQG